MAGGCRRRQRTRLPAIVRHREAHAHSTHRRGADTRRAVRKQRWQRPADARPVLRAHARPLLDHLLAQHNQGQQARLRRHRRVARELAQSHPTPWHTRHLDDALLQRSAAGIVDAAEERKDEVTHGGYDPAHVIDHVGDHVQKIHGSRIIIRQAARTRARQIRGADAVLRAAVVSGRVYAVLP